MTALPFSFEEHCAMTNSIAIGLGALIMSALALDMYLFGSDHLIFLSKKLMDLIEWMAFWR